jgi:hypothetical protein
MNFDHLMAREGKNEWYVEWVVHIICDAVSLRTCISFAAVLY